MSTKVDSIRDYTCVRAMSVDCVSNISNKDVSGPSDLMFFCRKRYNLTDKRYAGITG